MKSQSPSVIREKAVPGLSDGSPFIIALLSRLGLQLFSIDSGVLLAFFLCVIIPPYFRLFLAQSGQSHMIPMPLLQTASPLAVQRGRDAQSAVQSGGLNVEKEAVMGEGRAEEGKAGGGKSEIPERWSGKNVPTVLKAFLDDWITQEELEKELTNNPVGRIRVYVYNLPSRYNKNFVKKDPRCLSHMFAAEIFFHTYILRSPIRTTDPEEADWFYAPLYTTCDLTSSGLPLPFRAPRMVRSAIAHMARSYPFWNRTEGADHFFIVPHDFAACFHFQEEKAVERGIMGILKRATLVQTFGQSHHVCLKEGSIIIPPYAPPLNMKRRIIPDNTPRSIFVYFRGLFYDVNNDPEGGYYARGARASLWENFKDNPLFDISAEHPASYYEDMQRSVFCLCPLGWAPWSPRIVESVVFGCIPVIIADDIILPFSDVIPWQDIAVFVPEKDVPYMDHILGEIGPRRILAMQKRLASPAIKRAMMFSRPPLPGDCFYQILNGLARMLPHPPSAFLLPGQHVLNWSDAPPQDLKPWRPDSKGADW